VLNRKKAPEAGQGNEGETETHYYEGTIPMTVLSRTVRRIIRFPSVALLNAKLGHNIRAVAAEMGFSRATLQAAMGETWLHTQRAWFGVQPLAQTVLMTSLVMGVDSRRILPATPKSWA
jgi:hypothetical protein